MPGARLYNSMECLILIAELYICNLNCLDFSKDMDWRKTDCLVCYAWLVNMTMLARNMYTYIEICTQLHCKYFPSKFICIDCMKCRKSSHEVKCKPHCERVEIEAGHTHCVIRDHIRKCYKYSRKSEKILLEGTTGNLNLIRSCGFQIYNKGICILFFCFDGWLTPSYALKIFVYMQSQTEIQSWLYNFRKIPKSCQKFWTQIPKLPI